MKEQQKVYKHPILGREANKIGKAYFESDDVDGLFTEEQLKALGFEEVIQEKQKEVPEWFKIFLDSGDEDTTDEEMYELFLKHYPKGDALPVEEIVALVSQELNKEMMSSFYKHQDFRTTLRNILKETLRTYAIKDTSLLPLDATKYKSESNGAFSQEAIDKAASVLNRDKLLPLDVEKVGKEIRSCFTMASDGLVTHISKLDFILSKYGTPKVTKEEIENILREYSCDITDHEEAVVGAKILAKAKGLLAE